MDWAGPHGRESVAGERGAALAPALSLSPSSAPGPSNSSLSLSPRRRRLREHQPQPAEHARRVLDVLGRQARHHKAFWCLCGCLSIALLLECRFNARARRSSAMLEGVRLCLSTRCAERERVCVSVSASCCRGRARFWRAAASVGGSRGTANRPKTPRGATLSKTSSSRVYTNLILVGWLVGWCFLWVLWGVVSVKSRFSKVLRERRRTARVSSFVSFRRRRKRKRGGGLESKNRGASAQKQ